VPPCPHLPLTGVQRWSNARADGQETSREIAVSVHPRDANKEVSSLARVSMNKRLVFRATASSRRRRGRMRNERARRQFDKSFRPTPLASAALPPIALPCSVSALLPCLCAVVHALAVPTSLCVLTQPQCTGRGYERLSSLRRQQRLMVRQVAPRPHYRILRSPTECGHMQKRESSSVELDDAAFRDRQERTRGTLQYAQKMRRPRDNAVRCRAGDGGYFYDGFIMCRKGRCGPFCCGRRRATVEAADRKATRPRPTSRRPLRVEQQWTMSDPAHLSTR
jgi:hypothetical protein